MLRRRGLEVIYLAVTGLAALLMCVSARAASNDTIILHLKSGDRVSGVIRSEDGGHVVLSNRWIGNLSVPLDEIVRREKSQTPNSVPPGSTNAVASSHSSVMTNRWKGEAQVGLDVLYGGKGRQTYYARLKLAYERPYKSDPKEFFRNGFDYSGEYGRTDGVKSSDRMNGSDKAAFDIGRKWYVYNLAGIGYDHVLKIDLQYEAGPGIGYHLLTRTNFNLNLESGVNYQVQERSGSSDVRDFYYRLAEDSAWKINNRVSLIEKLELFPRIDLSEYRVRFETTLSYEIWRHFALNFTVLDLYDTRPASGVGRNELQIRSSLGVKF